MKFKKVFIEITNICGLQCTFCPQKESNPLTMDLVDFDGICSQVKDFTNEIALHVMGDPFVLSNLSQYVKIAQKYNLMVNITSSGFYLKNHNFEEFIASNIKQINFSLNSFNANTTSVSFDEYIGNILDFCDFKLKNHCNFFVNLRLWNISESDIDRSYNDLIVSKISDFFGVKIDLRSLVNPKNSIRVASKIFIATDEYFEWPSLSSEENSDGFCLGLKSHFAILANQDVAPCCLDKNAIINLGNIKKQTLDQILNSKKVKEIRNGFEQNICTEDLCKKCTYKNKFKEPN